MTADPSDVAKASAEALKATAEAANTGLEVVRDSGGFLARVFGGALEEYGAARRDRAALYRWKNMLKIMDEAQAIIEERGAAYGACSCFSSSCREHARTNPRPSVSV